MKRMLIQVYMGIVRIEDVQNVRAQKWQMQCIACAKYYRVDLLLAPILKRDPVLGDFHRSSFGTYFALRHVRQIVLTL